MVQELSTIFVYITYPSYDVAAATAKSLIQNHLAACVNIRPEGTSFYEWEGQLHCESEFVMIVKTDRSIYPEMEAHIKSLHPASIPCIVAFAAAAGYEPFTSWVKDQTAGFIQRFKHA